MGYRGGFSKNLPETSSCPKEPISAISKSGLALAKAKLISHSGKHVWNYKFKIKSCCTAAMEREARICESTPQGQWRRKGKEVLQALEQRFPFRLW